MLTKVFFLVLSLFSLQAFSAQGAGVNFANLKDDIS